MIDLAQWTTAAVDAATKPTAWRFSSDSLWRSAQNLRRLHERDVRLGRAGTSTKDTRDVRVMAVIFRRRHTAPPAPVAHVYMMLAGLSLEALAKGLLVARDPTRVTASTRAGHIDLGWRGSGHLDPALLDEAEIDLTKHERELVARLGVFVRWAGRYPVPRAVLDLAPRPGQSEPPASWSHEDFGTVSTLRERMRRDLDEAVMTRIRADRSQPGGDPLRSLWL